MQQKVCPVCGQQFRVKPHQASWRRYCSTTCMGLGFRRGEDLTCDYCGTLFYSNRAEIRKGRRFCSVPCADKGKTVSTLIRLMSNIRCDLVTRCWVWTGALDKKGYGRVFKLKHLGTAHAVFAHRALYEALVGPIPAGLGILHTCDTPACVRPEHLFPGTQHDNALDMARKGRGNGRFTEAQVLEIRERATQGQSQRRLARDYGVAAKTIAAILDGRTYAWVHGSTAPLQV